jgi:Na+/glutamate symporter
MAVGFGYRTTGLATTPIVQAPTFVCGLFASMVLRDGIARQTDRQRASKQAIPQTHLNSTPS